VKILVLNYEYPPVGGGGGRLTMKLCEAFVARGHVVRVVTAGVGSLAGRETRGGVGILRPQSFRRRRDTCTVPEMGLYLATSLPAALHEARRWKPDVVHAHFVVPTGLLALALRRLAGAPARAVWRGAAARTAVSSFVASLAEQSLGPRPEVILNGIPPVSAPAPRPPGPPKILMAGRLSIQKNPLLAIEALGRLCDLPWALEAR